MNKIKNLFCEDGSCGTDGGGKLCVRRVMGVLGFLFSLVAIAIGIEHESLQMFMLLSASLLGITTIDKFVQKPNCEVED